MPEGFKSNPDNLIELTADVVSAYVSNNPVPVADLPSLIEQVYAALDSRANGATEKPTEVLKPAVPIKKSVTPDYITCLEDGKKFKSPFRSADRAAIEHRRAVAMASAQPPRIGPRKLMIVVGEIKEIAPARASHKLVVKHMPGFVFLLDDGLHRRLGLRFGNEIALWSATDGSHLIVIATFGLTPAGLAIVEEMALMVVARNWVPYESVYEKTLVDALAKVKEQSVKALRYNLPRDVPIASAMFHQRERPIALYIVPPTQDGDYERKLDEFIRSLPETDAWIWRPSEGEMPPLPLR